MVSPLDQRLDVNKKAVGVIFPPLVCPNRTSLIVRLADRRPVGRHLVVPALAADVHALLCRDLVVRLVPVGSDFVVYP